MKKFLFAFSAFIALTAVMAKDAHAAAPGYIYLQVEERGEAWYYSPLDGLRYYLGRPDDALAAMKSLSLGATHDYIATTKIFPARLRGLILLDVGSRGEAYYIHPVTGQKHFLGRPADALALMERLAQGINNADLAKIPAGFINATTTGGSRILLDIPFSSQAPLGDWNDPRQADGCEETSALMAVHWARGEKLTPEETVREIIAISEYEKTAYGEFRDGSIGDTYEHIIKGYFNFPNAELKKDVTLEMLIQALKNNQAVIVPIDGEAVRNIYYQRPAPPHHMILLVGYDPVKRVFLAHDPGTAQGARYEYPAGTLFGAIRDYPSGYRLPVNEIHKDVILITK